MRTGLPDEWLASDPLIGRQIEITLRSDQGQIPGNGVGTQAAFPKLETDGNKATERLFLVSWGAQNALRIDAGHMRE